MCDHSPSGGGRGLELGNQQQARKVLPSFHSDGGLRASVTSGSFAPVPTEGQKGEPVLRGLRETRVQSLRGQLQGLLPSLKYSPRWCGAGPISVGAAWLTPRVLPRECRDQILPASRRVSRCHRREQKERLLPKFSTVRIRSQNPEPGVMIALFHSNVASPMPHPAVNIVHFSLIFFLPNDPPRCFHQLLL